MKTASLKLKSYANNVNIVNSGNLQRRILNTILLILVALALFYAFLLANMVFNIIERKALEVKAHTLANEVGDLELKYLSMSQKVDLNLAYSLGFKETKTKFATRKALSSVSSIEVAKNEI
jgi:hypothetical protein